MMRKKLLWVSITIPLILSLLNVNTMGVTAGKDIAVISVTPNPTSVIVGETVSITVDILNEGVEVEDVDVYAYADTDTATIGDEISLGPTTVSGLAPGASATVPFSWVTAAEGTYLISGEAVIAADVNPADNLLTDGTVTVFYARIYKRILPVPYYSQGDTDWCMPTSMSMIFKYYDQNIHSWDIAKDWGWDRDVSLWKFWEPTHGMVCEYFNNHGLTTEDGPKDFDTIKDWIDKDMPVIVQVSWVELEWPPRTVHAVVIVGYDLTDGFEKVYINDPSGTFVNEKLGLGSKPYIAVQVDWDDVFGHADWLMSVKGKPSPPKGTIDFFDTFTYYAVRFGHAVGQWPGVYSWYASDKGLFWERSEDHALALDSDDRFQFDLSFVNHLEYTQTYTFSVTFTKQVDEYKWRSFGRMWVVSVEGRASLLKISDLIPLRDLLKEYGEYTVTLQLWNEDCTEKYDEIVFPSIEYTVIIYQYLCSVADLYVTDPLGRHVGVDPSTGQVVNQIPGAIYTGPGSEPQVIAIPNPLDGNYVVLLVGTATGNYSVTTELITLEETITQTYTGDIVEGEFLEYIATVSETDVTTNSPVPPILVDKNFKPDEVSQRRSGSVMSWTYINNTGYLSLSEITFNDTILDGWTIKDLDRTISVTLFIDGLKYQIPYDELDYVAIEDCQYIVYINFTAGVDLYQFNATSGMEEYRMTIYAFEPGWILEIKYPMHPPTDLLAGDYEETVSVTVVSPEGITVTVEDAATLHVK